MNHSGKWAKRLVFGWVWLLVVVSGAAGESANGAGVLHVQDLYFRETTLDMSNLSPACVLFFYSNTCPVARRYVPRVIQLEAEFRSRGVRFVAVNVGDADTIPEMARFAQQYGLTFPVVKDRDFSLVKGLGITRTPEVAVLDQRGALVYRGRIDDQYRLGGVQSRATHSELLDALNAVLNGSSVPTARVPAEGCVVTPPEPPGSSHPPNTLEPAGQRLFMFHCLPCHVEEGAGPFSLATFDALRGRQAEVRRAVEEWQMPPCTYLESEALVTSCNFIGSDEGEILLRWLSGPLDGNGPIVDPGSTATAFNRSVRADGVPRVLATGVQDWSLGQVSDRAEWITAIRVVGSGEAASLYYTLTDSGLEQHFLAGGLLPGVPLTWQGDAGIALPEGASLQLTLRGGGDSAPVVYLQTQTQPPARSLTCHVKTLTLNSQADSSIDLVAPVSKPQSYLRTVAVEISGYGAAVSVSAVNDAGGVLPVFNVPAVDPRWTQPVTVNTAACQVKATINFPRYLRSVNGTPGEDQQKDSDIAVAIYIHSAADP